MKKIVFPFLMGVVAICIAVSCKHELPGPALVPDLGSGGSSGGSTPPVSSTCNPDSVYFQQQVLPIFISNCSMSGCHDATTRQHGVNLTSYTSIMATGDIRPGNPGNSKAYKKIMDTDPGDRMPPPPRNPLTTDQKNLIYKWILQGAKNNSCVNSACDTSNVTYSLSIRNILSAKCQGCHSSSAPAAGYDFTSYAVVRARAMDGKLWGAVNHLPGYSPMPKNGNKLSTCELAQIRKWIDAGAPNN